MLNQFGPGGHLRSEFFGFCVTLRRYSLVFKEPRINVCLHTFGKLVQHLCWSPFYVYFFCLKHAVAKYSCCTYYVPCTFLTQFPEAKLRHSFDSPTIAWPVSGRLGIQIHGVWFQSYALNKLNALFPQISYCSGLKSVQQDHFWCSSHMTCRIFTRELTRRVQWKALSHAQNSW